MACRAGPRCLASVAGLPLVRLESLMGVRPSFALRRERCTRCRASNSPFRPSALPLLTRALHSSRPRLADDDKNNQSVHVNESKPVAGRQEQEPQQPVQPTKSPLRQKLRERLQQTLPHENIYTLPNILTFSRLASTPVIGYLIVAGQPYAACALFAYAGVTDLLDGWIARRFKMQTVVGTVIDPIADKTLMTVLTVCLAIKGALPVWLATLILGRDASLAVAAVYYRYASLPAPRTLARYWDFSLPSAEVHPTNISKLNTLLQLVLLGLVMALPLASDAGVSEVPLPLPRAVAATEGGEGVGAGAGAGWMQRVDVKRAVELAQWTVAGTTVWSGLSYLYTRDAVKILGKQLDADTKRQIVRRGRGVIGVCFVGCAGVAVGLERALARRGDEADEGDEGAAANDG